ncbi:MAG: hypothetical protein RLZZ385_1853 [Pseudomonadota bacterium]|jgi:dolichyl-phosphate beta-glucosyltransferase
MSVTNQPDVSIVIPAFNEAGRLPASLGQIRAYLDFQPLTVEVLVMVERSTDDTLRLAREAVAGDERFQVVDGQVQRGKGYAVRNGMLKARGGLVFFMDADLSTPLEEIADFIGHFKAHPRTDIIIGSRALAHSRVEKPQGALRQTMGRTFNRLVKRFGVPGITDTQCGFKAFRQAAAREIFTRQKLDGFAFDVEVLMLARALDYRVDVKPVRWINSPDSRVDILWDSARMLRDLVRLRALVRRTLKAQPAGAGPAGAERSAEPN